MSDYYFNKYIIKRKEQARIIENNIRLFFETSIRLHSTSPKHTPQSLLAATKRHMAGDSAGLTSITASTLRQLLQTAPASLLSEIEEMVIFDTGATRAVSYDENDFVGPLRPITKRLAGIGAGLDVEGIGTIRWEFRDDKGKPFIVQVEGYYVPECRVKLLSRPSGCIRSTLLSTYLMPLSAAILQLHMPRLCSCGLLPILRCCGTPARALVAVAKSLCTVVP